MKKGGGDAQRVKLRGDVNGGAQRSEERGREVRRGVKRRE